MSFGVYFHIPYCLQRCSYCDFATYEQSQILPPEQYVKLVQNELAERLPPLGPKEIDTVYFGGGTPSLIPAELIVDLLGGLAKHGFRIKPSAEITIEINPATLDHNKMKLYLGAGINRFSVGAQSFDDGLLKMVRREHNARQTRDTLDFLKSYGVNYSFDLLFALPHQSLEMLKKDLDEVLTYSPPHVSPYCLTVPEGHSLTANRPPEGEQLEMFELINSTLRAAGYHRYEISNFAKPGYESRHNSLYWNDSEYLGLGLGAHSYLHKSLQTQGWGVRFWNPNSIGAYEKQFSSSRKHAAGKFLDLLPSEQHERLRAHQALTDFCHISLRTAAGLSQQSLENKFGQNIGRLVVGALRELAARGDLVCAESVADTRWSLSESGMLVSNQVFQALTYLEGELPES